MCVFILGIHSSPKMYLLSIVRMQNDSYFQTSFIDLYYFGSGLDGYY